MNRIFRIIWSQGLSTWVVVSELTTRRGKRSGGGEVDERVAPPALTLDRGRVEGSPPATAWALRLGIALALLGAAPAHAADLYWDINGNTAGAGGTTPSGTWSTTDSTLTTDINGNLVVVPRTTTTADRLFFSAGADATGSYTVTVNGTQNINRLTFQEGNVLLTGGIINFGGTTPTIDADATTDTIASTITGAFGTTGIGFVGGSAGSLRLTGTNTYTGTTRVGTNLILDAAGGNALSGDLVQFGSDILATQNGTITLNAANQIADTARVSLIATNLTGSHVFSLNGFNETIAGLDMRRDGNIATATVRNGAATDATLTLTGTGNYTAGLGNSLSGRSVTDGGAGRLHLVLAMGTGRQSFWGTTANYTGTTTLNSGTLILQNTSTWASDIILNGGSLTLSQQTAAGTGGSFAGAAVRTHANTISGTGGSIVKNQDGTVILSGINTYQGGTVVQTGTLQAGSTSAFGINSAVRISGGATLNLNGFNNSIGSLQHTSGTSAGTVQLGSATLTTGGNNTNTVFSGVISGTGNLVKVGTGTQSLTGTNNYTGTTTINDGTLQLGFVGPFSPNVGDGMTGTLGTGAVTVGATGTLAFNRVNAHTVANTINGTGTLAQVNTGTTTLTANNTIGTTTISAGTLDIDGVLNTGTVTMGNGTLNVDGTVQASGATQTVIGNTAGTASTVAIGTGGTLLATGDLGDGNDTLDMSGTLNTGAGAFLLGDGDDNFFIHDGTNVIGTVVGGAGVDTYIYDIAGIANVGALSEFEGLTKRGAGTVNLTGGVSDLANVRVEQGTLNVQAGASVVAQGTGSLNTLVAAGTTFNVDGSYTTSTNTDTFDVFGTVGGTGTIDLNDGDDTLILHDTADLSGLANAIDGGAGNDTFTADLAGSATLGGAINFETLTKTNTGTLIVAGAAPSTFTTVNVDGGTLDVGAAGSIGGVTQTTVASGATLNVNGSYTGSTGNDTMDVAGTIAGASAIDLADGDDTLTLNDSAVLNNVIDGGAHGAGDTVVLNSVNALTFDGGSTVNFELLNKTGAGTATLTGVHSFSGTTVDGGTLDVDGALETSTVTLADGATLNADGLVMGAGGTAAAISGSAGSNTVVVGAGGILFAAGDLGDGNDVLDVAGMLDTGGGAFDLGDGDDSFVVHDGTNVIGTVDGGAGLDTRVYDINLTADLGALVNFEGVTKTGAGTLNLNAGATDLQEVEVLGGTLNIGAGASVAATAGSSLNTVVGSGATLNVDGSFGCGAGADTISVSGAVTGSGTVDLCGGDDTLILNDGAVLSIVIDGNDPTASDTVVLNNAGAMTFDAGNTVNFEHLQKDNTGEATLIGTQSFAEGTTINGGMLTVAGSLETPTVTLADATTLNVDGALQGTGGTAAAITGSAGANTVTVGGTLLANGDLGAGNDVLDVMGTLDTAGGTFALGDGDDTLTIHDGTTIIGTVVAGTGNDTFNTDIAASADLGAVQGFETLSKSGIGVLNINGPMSSDFSGVNVLAGTLNVTVGGSVIAQNTTVAAGSTLQVDGSYTGTTGNDTFTVAGIVAGTSNVDLLEGDDAFTIQDGADLSGLANAVDGGAGTDTFVADLAGEATLGGAINFETLTKTNTGTLNIDGLAPSAFTTVNVEGGTLDVGVGGSVDGVVATTVVNGATLNVDGRYTGSGGNDTMIMAGTVTGNGTVALLDGNDIVTLQDGVDLTGLVNALDGGTGTDTVTAQVASSMMLGPMANFETLQKTGVGELTLAGDQAYDTTLVDAGTLTIAAGTALTSHDTTVAAGATLDVQGDFTGTAGDDSFTSRGNVIGALGFADGNDTVAFIGGDLSGLTGVDGGAGGSDRLGFSGLSFDGGDFAMANWERVELLNDSAMTLGSALALGGVLAIDATSQLLVNAGASVGGSVENAGLISVGANRLAVSGGYNANNGALQLLVSPGGGTSGGLDVAGDVTGNTLVTFASDGTDVPLQQDASILVVSSANDDLATAGGFTAADAVNGHVRLTGSISPWNFGQHADKSWYLDAVAGILPETAGYAVVPSIGQANILDNNRLLFQRMDSVRSDTQHCNARDSRQAYGVLTGECQGVWTAATGSELEMGANPGFEFSGDNVGAYVGVDGMLQDRETRTFRGGLFAGFQRGNYWTTGANSTDLPGTGESNVQVDTPTFGMYGSFNWRGGSYADVSLVAQLPEATIAVADGFHQEISGSTLTLSAQMGHRFQLGNGWMVEPQVQLSASAMQWGDTVDASGKELVLDDDTFGTARASVRVEKAFETAGGARVRPWATLGLQDTMGEKQEAFSVMLPGSSTGSQAFPNHELGLTATLDVGVEAELNKSVSLFGALSYGESLGGSDSEQRQANLGVRIRW